MAKKINTEIFIERAKLKHGDTYDYSKVKYIDSNTKVEIICPIHGSFWLTPAKHIYGRRCPYCFGTRRKTTEEFIKEALEIHGNKYDYSKTIYGKSNRDPVEIICPIHGSFWQTPVHHINSKCGCPKCNRSHGETVLANYFDKNNIEYQENFIVEVPIDIRPTGIIKVDFFLPSFNTFVEYNGKQHYIMLENFGGKLKFDKLVLRDEYLRYYCKLNQINLIEIPYTEENIEGFLEQHLTNENISDRRCPREKILEKSDTK